MKNPKDIFTLLKTPALTTRERSVLTQQLAEYRAMKPLPETVGRALHGARAHTFNLFALRGGPVFASFMLFAVIGVSSAAAAEGAVPGDLLYPIKTAVNESAREALTFTASARAEVSAWKAERRLEEARTLALRGSLTEDRKATLEARFAQHAERVEEQIDSLSLEDPARAAHLATRFETSLVAHETILASREVDAPRTIGDLVREHIARIGERRRLAVLQIVPEPAFSGTIGATFSLKSAPAPEETHAEDTATLSIRSAASEPAIEATANEVPPTAPSVDQASAARFMYVRAEQSVRETMSWYLRKENALNDADREHARVALREAEETLTESRRLYAEGLYGDAFLVLRDTVGSLNELSVFLKNSTSLDLESRIRVGTVEPVDPLPSDLPVYEEVAPPPQESLPLIPVRPGAY